MAGAVAAPAFGQGGSQAGARTAGGVGVRFWGVWTFEAGPAIGDLHADRVCLDVDVEGDPRAFDSSVPDAVREKFAHEQAQFAQLFLADCPVEPVESVTTLTCGLRAGAQLHVQVLSPAIEPRKSLLSRHPT